MSRKYFSKTERHVGARAERVPRPRVSDRVDMDHGAGRFLCSHDAQDPRGFTPCERFADHAAGALAATRLNREIGRASADRKCAHSAPFLAVRGNQNARNGPEFARKRLQFSRPPDAFAQIAYKDMRMPSCGFRSNQGGIRAIGHGAKQANASSSGMMAPSRVRR